MPNQNKQDHTTPAIPTPPARVLRRRFENGPARSQTAVGVFLRGQGDFSPETQRLLDNFLALTVKSRATRPKAGRAKSEP